MICYINRITGKASNMFSPFTYTLTLPENFTLSKMIKIPGEDIQKKDDIGRPLYKTNIRNEEGIEIYDETIEKETVVKYETKKVTSNWTNDLGEEFTKVSTVKEPVEWVVNPPIMLPTEKFTLVTLKEQPQEFDVEEILKEKYTKILTDSHLDFIIADMFLDESDMDLNDPNHSANTGLAFVQLLPLGQVKTLPIELERPSFHFQILEYEGDEVDIYLAGKKFVNGVLDLTTPVNTCTIKFVNPRNEFKDIKSYAIGY